MDSSRPHAHNKLKDYSSRRVNTKMHYHYQSDIWNIWISRFQLTGASSRKIYFEFICSCSRPRAAQGQWTRYICVKVLSTQSDTCLTSLFNKMHFKEEKIVHNNYFLLYRGCIRLFCRRYFQIKLMKVWSRIQKNDNFLHARSLLKF